MKEKLLLVKEKVLLMKGVIPYGLSLIIIMISIFSVTRPLKSELNGANEKIGKLETELSNQNSKIQELEEEVSSLQNENSKLEEVTYKMYSDAELYLDKMVASDDPDDWTIVAESNLASHDQLMTIARNLKGFDYMLLDYDENLSDDDWSLIFSAKYAYLTILENKNLTADITVELLQINDILVIEDAIYELDRRDKITNEVYDEISKLILDYGSESYSKRFNFDIHPEEGLWNLDSVISIADQLLDDPECPKEFVQKISQSGIEEISSLANECLDERRYCTDEGE